MTCAQALLGDGAVRDKSRLPERRLRDANSDFIGEQQLQQQVGRDARRGGLGLGFALLTMPPASSRQLMAEQQDEQLELVSGTIGVLKNMSERIGLELDEQAE